MPGDRVAPRTNSNARRERSPPIQPTGGDRSKSGFGVKSRRRCADYLRVEPVWALCLLGPRRALSRSAFHTYLMTAATTPSATRFLVVDDFPTMRRILRNLLAELGFRQVEEAGDGRAALDLLKQQPFDFVISDINMPRVNGYDLLRQIRADSAIKSLPVLLVIAEANKDDVVQAIRLGANGTILKPLTKSTLEEKVRNILLRSSAWPSGGTAGHATITPAAKQLQAPAFPIPAPRNA